MFAQLSLHLRGQARRLGPGWAQRRFNSNLVLCEFTRQDSVAIITLNDPKKLNALTVAMGDQLLDTIEDLNNRPQLRSVIVRGAGRAFSAGGDLDWLLERHRDTHGNNQRVMVDFYKRFLALRTLNRPVIAAINGPAIGAGMCLALGGCDIRVAHEKARMGLTFVKLGLHPGMASTHFLPKIVGPSLASEMLLTGRILEASEALAKGIVSRVSKDPMEDALEIADEIAQAAPIAVETTIKTLRKAIEFPVSLEDSMTRESQAQAITYPTDDLLEGVNALKEKREPVFKGR